MLQENCRKLISYFSVWQLKKAMSKSLDNSWIFFQTYLYTSSKQLINFLQFSGATNFSRLESSGKSGIGKSACLCQDEVSNFLSQLGSPVPPWKKPLMSRRSAGQTSVFNFPQNFHIRWKLNLISNRKLWFNLEN